MDKITIADLEVFYRVGVPDEERAQPQRLLLTIEMEHDFTTAAAADSIDETINYFAVSQLLLKYGEGRSPLAPQRSWKLIETLASNLAEEILARFRPASVTVTVKKFIIPEARHVAVTLMRKKSA